MIPVAKTMTTAAAAELLCDIAERLAESRGRTIIAIDGRCAGGKTTLAHAAEELLLARGIPCRTLHTDDFFPSSGAAHRAADENGGRKYGL